MKKSFYWLVSLFVLVLFCLNEYCYSFSGNADGFFVQRILLKFGISFTSVLLAFAGLKRFTDRTNLLLFMGLLFCCIGDVVINLHIVAGAMVFLVGHLFFVKSFIHGKAPSMRIFVIWAVFATVMVTGIVLMRCYVVPDFDSFLVTAGIIYVVFMTAMVSFSFMAPGQLCAGGVIFGISDILLICNLVFGTTPLSHIISLGVYYVAIFIISDYVFKGKHISSSN